MTPNSLRELGPLIRSAHSAQLNRGVRPQMLATYPQGFHSCP